MSLRRERQKVFLKRILIRSVFILRSRRSALHLSNRFTLSTIFARDLDTPENIAKWGQHIVSVVLAGVKA